MPINKLYSVIGSVDGNLQSFGAGLTLDEARILEARLTTDGIGGPRTTDTGERSGIQNARVVSNIQVVQNDENGEALSAQSVEQFTIADAAQLEGKNFWYFTPAETVLSVVSAVASVPGDFNVKLLRDGKIEVSGSIFSNGNTVDVTYNYATTAKLKSGQTTLTDAAEIDGTATIFTLDHKYNLGSTVVTATPPAGKSLYRNEGGGNLIEIGLIDDTTGAKEPFPVANGNIVVDYSYSSGDQADPPANDTFRSGFDRVAVTPGVPQQPPIE